MASQQIQCDERTQSNYGYRRYFWDESKRVFTLIEVNGGEFGSIYIPETLSLYFRDIFSTSMPSRGSNHMQALHHSRKHDKCYSITITKTSEEPVSYKPFMWGENTKKKTQYILLDVESMIKFLEVLPEYVDNIIPCFDNQARSAEVERVSEYSTFTTTSQVRGNCTLKNFVTGPKKEQTRLGMSLVQFTKSWSINLRYETAGVAGYGVYIPTMVCDWLMEEREKMLNFAQRLGKDADSWRAVDTALFKQEVDAMLTPWSSPEAEDAEGGTAKRSKYSPMSKEAIGAELDGILGDAIA